MSPARIAVWGAALVLVSACVGSGSYGASGHYPSPPPASEPTPAVGLLSAQVSEYRALELVDSTGAIAQGAVLVLVFAVEVDPLTVAPEAFAVVRADGRRVRPTEAWLGPADEGDEHRSVQLVGMFGQVGAEPVAVQVLGPLFSEGGDSLAGLDAAVAGVAQADRLVAVERLEPSERRCPGAKAVIRTYWSDAITGLREAGLAQIELLLADGSIAHPSGVDDQRLDSGEPAALGPADDNVLDLCSAAEQAITRVRVPAGLLQDAHGRPSAAGELPIPTS